MNNLMKLSLFAIVFIGINLTAEAGFLSKVGNWFNTGWNDYGYPSHNSYYNNPHRNSFYNNGNFTGITPPINAMPSVNYQPDADYYCPNQVNRFNHLPYGQIPNLNIPTRTITDFSSNVGTSSRIQILD